MGITAIMQPRCATRRKLGIQKYKGQVDPLNREVIRASRMLWAQLGQSGGFGAH
jgi:hypothetical protein